MVNSSVRGPYLPAYLSGMSGMSVSLSIVQRGGSGARASGAWNRSERAQSGGGSGLGDADGVAAVRLPRFGFAAAGPRARGAVLLPRSVLLPGSVLPHKSPPNVPDAQLPPCHTRSSMGAFGHAAQARRGSRPPANGAERRTSQPSQDLNLLAFPPPSSPAADPCILTASHLPGSRCIYAACDVCSSANPLVSQIARAPRRLWLSPTTRTNRGGIPRIPPRPRP